ncbi:hypothetical protein [Myroides odoratimimus]|uniref:hypothetical protein n=1 Tax=Myroides odoratimimus TaxID=76832 RepID=UPI0025777404|nr:hypothetical protein [Myroides odoratimimus]MDM1530946.1 hypothetical protein [Myroides odoratimimus]
MREFSLTVLDFQLQEIKKIFISEIENKYFHYNYSIYEVDVKFLNVNDFQDYLVTTRIEKKLLLKNIYKLSNDIIELYIENESLEYLKESEEIENSLPSDWKRKLSDRAIAQVKGGFICLRVEERKIRVFQEYYEIGGFNKAYNQDLCVRTNIRDLLRDIELIWRLIEKYYPDVRVDYFKTYCPNLLKETEQTQSKKSTNSNLYYDIFKGNVDDSYNLFNTFLKENNKDDLYNSVSFLVIKMKGNDLIRRDVSYKSIVNFLGAEGLIPVEYHKFNDNASFNNRAQTKGRKILYDNLRIKFLSSE